MICPKCGSSDTYDRWQTDRKLKRGCRDCNWSEPPRIPEIKEIQNVKFVSPGWTSSSFTFEIFDKYGHTAMMSRGYSTQEKAREELLKELAKHNRHADYAPCTGILWPNRAKMVGEIVKLDQEE